MYRIKKALNHNTVIGIDYADNQEYMIVGKGIGFGKRVSEQFEAPADANVYSLVEITERGSAKELMKDLDPVYLEIADAVLREAEKTFGRIDHSILFPMADHIAFAVRRVRKGEQISNPLNDDIQALFHMEFKAASCIREILKERMELEIEDDEIGYIALHIHSAIEDEKVSQAMMIAQTVRECISLVEEQKGSRIDIQSLSYNRLMNHVKYMAARAMKGEKLKLNMNDYMEVKFPASFELATTVCDFLSGNLKCPIDEVEIGYLAMHIERVYDDESIS